MRWSLFFGGCRCRGLTASIFFALASGDPRPIHFFKGGGGLSLGTPDRFIFLYTPCLGGDPRPIVPSSRSGGCWGTARGARRAGNVGGGRGLALLGGRIGAKGWGGGRLGPWGGWGHPCWGGVGPAGFCRLSSSFVGRSRQPPARPPPESPSKGAPS